MRELLMTDHIDILHVNPTACNTVTSAQTESGGSNVISHISTAFFRLVGSLTSTYLDNGPLHSVADCYKHVH